MLRSMLLRRFGPAGTAAAAVVALLVFAATPAGARPFPDGLHATLPTPLSQHDPADVSAPLDLRAAVFGQTARGLELRIRVRGPVPADLGTSAHALCLVAVQHRPART